MHTQIKNALRVAVIGALLMPASQTITVCYKMIDFSIKLYPITRFIPQKLSWIVWDSDPSGFGILKCPSLITSKRATSDGAYLRGLAPVQHSSKEIPHRWRAVGEWRCSVRLDQLEIEPHTSHTDRDMLNN